MLSPCAVGSEETRRSRVRPSTVTWMRPSCGTPLFRDADVGHDLQPRDDGKLETLGRGFDLVQHAVDPVAHAETPLQRLQMNIGCPAPDRVGNDILHEPDDRGIASVDRIGGRGGAGFRRALAFQLGKIPTIGAIDGLPDIGSCCECRPYRRTGDIGQAVHEIDPDGVGYSHLKHAPLPGKWHHGVFHHKGARQGREDVPCDGPVSQLYPSEPKFLRHRPAESLTLSPVRRQAGSARQQSALAGDLHQGIVGGGH